MLIHHIATLSLISGSYTYNYIPIGKASQTTSSLTHTPLPLWSLSLSSLSLTHTHTHTTPGSLVMVAHDLADSILELAKLFNYISIVRPWAQTVRQAAQ